MWFSILTHTHTYSGRGDHGGTELPPGSYRKLAKWCRKMGVDALGMGSPYTPKTAALYYRFDGDERDVYYDPQFDKQSLINPDDIADMLDQANRASQGDNAGPEGNAGRGSTFFYLDNETPKARYGHLWWVGFRRDMPDWHDYDQPFDRWMINELAADDFSDEPMPYERRPYLQILAAQRAKGALGFWAHPTSWWTGERGQFVTNIATEMPAHAIAEGGLDGMVVMGYHPYRPEYQAIWFDLLDRGYRVPGVAEMDAGLSDAKLYDSSRAMLTHIHCQGDESLTVARACEGFRNGRMFASTGPFVELTVDAVPMGQIASTSAAQEHDVQIAVRNSRGDAAPLARVELIGSGGKILWHRNEVRPGATKLNIPGLSRRGYLIARVFEDYSEHWKTVRSFAVSNPVYLHPRGANFENPATTELSLDIDPSSPIVGGEIRFESMAGELYSATVARPGKLQETLPASGRITIVSNDGHCQTRYLVNANEKLADVQRYLYRGRFRRDFPSLKPGEVPPAAWRIDEYVEAMREVKLRL